jgi:hypothetical protein
MGGEKHLKHTFEQCWDEMVGANAINIKKCGGAASLTSHPKDITDDTIRKVVEWALDQSRRVTCSP